MRYNNSKLINEIEILVHKYDSFQGIASEDYNLSVSATNDEALWQPLKKGEKFSIDIDYGDPDTMFHIELYANGVFNSARETFYDDESSLQDVLKFVKMIIARNDLKSSINPNYKAPKPYEAPRTTLEGTINDVNERLKHYQLDCKVNILCSYESEERNFATMTIEYEKCTQQELDYFDEQYYEGGQYDHDCKHEQWDWLKNEC